VPVINRRTVTELQLLAEQRGRLLERIAQQRVALQVQWEPLQQTASKADRVLAATAAVRRYIQAHRRAFTLTFSVTCGVLMLIKPVRSWRLLKSGFVLWRGWRAVQSAQMFVPGSFWGAVLKLARRRFVPSALN
jgi:hypothetical protein